MKHHLLQLSTGPKSKSGNIPPIYTQSLAARCLPQILDSRQGIVLWVDEELAVILMCEDVCSMAESQRTVTHATPTHIHGT